MNKKTVSFGTIDPNLGVWGRVIPNFYKSLFFMEDLARFCRKFPVNVPNLQKVLGCVHKFGSIVPNKTFFLSFLRVGGGGDFSYSLLFPNANAYKKLFEVANCPPLVRYRYGHMEWPALKIDDTRKGK